MDDSEKTFELRPPNSPLILTNADLSLPVSVCASLQFSWQEKPCGAIILTGEPQGDLQRSSDIDSESSPAGFPHPS